MSPTLRKWRTDAAWPGLTLNAQEAVMKSARKRQVFLTLRQLLAGRHVRIFGGCEKRLPGAVQRVTVDRHGLTPESWR